MNILSKSIKLHSYRNNLNTYCYVYLNETNYRSLSTGQWKKYLAILKIDSTSTTKDIKDSFLKLSKIYHPDNKLTGSHARFVELKEAYDALKDGHPTSATSSITYKSPYDYDLSHRSQVKYRDTYQRYANQAPNSQAWGHGNFGQPPGGQSKTAWEAYSRERQYRKQRADWDAFGQRRPFSSGASFTIFLGAIAWIIIYSSVLLIWDYNDAVRRGLSRYKARNLDDYVAYEEYLKRKEQRKLLNLKDNGDIYTPIYRQEYKPKIVVSDVEIKPTTTNVLTPITSIEVPDESDIKPSRTETL